MQTRVWRGDQEQRCEAGRAVGPFLPGRAGPPTLEHAQHTLVCWEGELQVYPTARGMSDFQQDGQAK